MTQVESESYTIKGGIRVVERFFNVPLDYGNPQGKHIRIYARNLVPLEKTKEPPEQSKLPYLLYLQGGPGFEVELQSSLELASIIHAQGYQTLWLDPRGTGLSTPVSAELMTEMTDEEKVQYLKNFRADNIVRDCEFIRNTLLGDNQNPEDRKWTILGQSYGGFCALNYLTYHSHALKEVFLTGGLAPLVDQPDPVYRALMGKVIERNKVYYDKYPRDIVRVRQILRYLDDNHVETPNGGHLTPRRFLQLGLDFGMHGGIDRVHQLVLRATNDLETVHSLSYRFLQNIQMKQEFDSNPLFAIMHEQIYCQGRHAADWAGVRVLADYPQFQWHVMKSESEHTPVFFTGEMLFPEMFDDFSNLRSLKGAAELMAKDDDWCIMYDLDQLSKNPVKVSAATYVNDMYVHYGLAQQTAATVANTEQFITNQHLHSAIRTDPKTIMAALFGLSKRESD
ncbi:alpha/beta-hydrolase [Gyrodon lividus]|nr:alpha/beta-hydrolase [Gyrodon lividus]